MYSVLGVVSEYEEAVQKCLWKKSIFVINQVLPSLIEMIHLQSPHCCDCYIEFYLF